MRRRAIPVLGLLITLGISGIAYAWQPPVGSPVVDNWRPPTASYGAGNRGVDFAPPAGAVVKSAGDGVVTFAGQVGGTLYVVVSHGGDLRTTYGDLASINVKVGQQVQVGESVGEAGPHLHFGVRHGTQYVDPNTLFGHPVLIPTEQGASEVAE